MNQQELQNALDVNNLKKRVTELPYFYGTAKDGVLTGRLLIEKIERAAKIPAVPWDDARKINELEACLQDRALLWYHGVQNAGLANFNTWNIVKRQFLRRYDVAGTVNAAPITLEQLVARPGEAVGDYFGRSSQNWKTAVDRFPDAVTGIADADVAKLEAAADAAGRRVVLLELKTEWNLMVVRFFQQATFINGLPPHIRPEIAKKQHATLMDAYDAAVDFEAAQLSIAKKTAAVAAVTEEATEEDDVDIDAEPENEEQLCAINYKRGLAGLSRKPRPAAWKKPNNNGFAHRPQKQQGQFKCRYCKKPGHSQQNCNARIRDGAPCVDQFGKPWINQPTGKKVNDVVTAAPQDDQVSTLRTASLNSSRVAI